MTYSGAKTVLSGWKASIAAPKSGADKKCKCLQNKADGIFGKTSGQRIDGALPTCTANAAAYDE